MGEQKEGAKNGGGDQKKEEANVPVVLKMDMHCEGCARKVRRAVSYFDGVENVTVDSANNKLTVIGKVDPTKIKEKLEDKTKKKVEIISPQPKKDGGGDKKSAGDKPAAEKKGDDKQKPEEKKPKETAVAFKIQTHCDGCIKKIKRIISKVDGVNTVNVDAAKDLVFVTGTMDVKKLTPYLRDKLRRSVELVPPAAKKDDGESGKKDTKEGGGGGGGEKKEKKEGGGGGGDKKEKEAAGGEKEGGGDGGGKKEEKKKEESGGGEAAPKMELSKMEYQGYAQPGPSFFYSTEPMYAQPYAIEPYNYYPGYANPGYAYQPGYANPGYAFHHQQGYMTHYGHEGHNGMHIMDTRAPQMFSDENPNGCWIM